MKGDLQCCETGIGSIVDPCIRDGHKIKGSGMNISGHISESLEAILSGSGIRKLFLIFDSMYFFPLVMKIRSKVNADPDLTTCKKR
jgi:hypothetical protein